MHQSALEARRCDELHALQTGGLIESLEAHPQPTYRLDINGIHVADYHPDFRYRDAKTHDLVVEDCKGYSTEVYKLKKRLMLAIFGIEIQEIRRIRGRRR